MMPHFHDFGLSDAGWMPLAAVAALPALDAALRALVMRVVDVGRAAREIALCEAAEMRLLVRLEAMRCTVLAVETDLALLDLAGTRRAPKGQDDPTGLEALWQDLRAEEALLPLELAHRADERDRAMSRLSEARSALSRLLSEIEALLATRAGAPLQCDAFEAEGLGFHDGWQRLSDLCEQALDRPVDEIIRAARAEARARTSGAPVADPESCEFHMTQPEGWAAWSALRLVPVSPLPRAITVI